MQFLDAHTVFPRHRTADIDAVFQDFHSRLQCVLNLRFIGIIVEKNRMDIPITGMKCTGDLQSMLLTDLRDALQDLRQFAARHTRAHARAD